MPLAFQQVSEAFERVGACGVKLEYADQRVRLLGVRLDRFVSVIDVDVFVLLRWSETLLNIAREASGQGEPEAARVCAERVKDVALKVLKFDADNQRRAL